MICNKCGAQCDDNQAFCLKCGNPIQLTADFNLIEKELASSIDELMNEIEADGDNLPEEAEELKTIDVPLEEINMGLKLVDINRNQPSHKEEAFDDEDEEDITPLYIPSSKKDNGDNNSRKSKNGKKSNKKLYAIIGGVAAAIALIAIVLILVLGGDDDNSGAKKSFSDYYTSAETSYNSGDMDKALEDAYEALKVIGNDNDEVKVRKLIHNIYNQQNFTGAIYLQNIEALIALGDTSEDYYGVVVKKYIEDKNTDMLIELVAKVGDEKAKEYFGENYVDKPTASEDEGEYKNYMTLELKAAEGLKIFYAINDDINKTAAEYTGALELKELGENVVQAYAVNEMGIPSSVAEFTYNIVEGEMDGPVVEPDEGTYSEPTQITVVVPEGSKAYYTYTEEGVKPDQSSTEYTEPVDMIRGVNKFKVIVVDKYGNVSSVTTMLYNLKLDRTETITSGEEKVRAYYYNNGKIDPNGQMADGSTIEITYEDAVVIDNNEYYVYNVVATLVQGETSSVTGITYVGVNTYDGTVIDGLIQSGDEYVLPEQPE